MHKTLVFVIFPPHSSVFHHITERFVKFDAVLHHDLSILVSEGKERKRICKGRLKVHRVSFGLTTKPL